MSPNAQLSKEDAFLVQVSKLARRWGQLFVPTTDADDIAQDIVLDYLEAFRAGTAKAVRKDLSGMVRNKVVCRIVDLHRATLRRAQRDAQFLASLGEVTPAWMSPELQVEEGELTDLVTRTLDTFTPLCRTVYLMIRNDEESYLSVASTLGITRSAVCSHVVIAQRRLRAALSDWLDERAVQLSPPHTQEAETDATVTVQPANTAA